MIYFILRHVKDIPHLTKIFKSAQLINKFCDVISYNGLRNDRVNVLRLRGYFVNEILNRKRVNDRFDDETILTISSQSPDRVKIPETNLLTHECISATKDYTVVYIPHDQLENDELKDEVNQFCIPFKLQVLKNNW